MCLFVILNHYVNLKYAFLILDFMLCIVGLCEVSPKSEGAKELPVVIFWGYLFFNLYCIK